MIILKARTVAAGHGWLWIKQAFAIFKLNAMLWIGLCTAIVLLGALFGMVPMIGSLVFQLIAPALTAGLILGCQAQQQGKPLDFNCLLSGFKSHGAQLITIGGIYLTGMLIIAAIVGMLGGEPLIRAMTEGHPDAQSIAASGIMGMSLLPVLLGLLLLMPLLMAYWFAPALVVFADYSPVNAMKASLAATTKNFAAFLVYGIAIFGLFILASLPVMLGFLVMIPLAFISYYTSYIDVFGEAETPVVVVSA